jgi:hypothetical protein
MNILIIFSAIILSITKVIDACSTFIKIKTPAQERNKFAKKIMLKIGMVNTLRCMTIFALLVIVLASYIAVLSTVNIEKIGFIVIANLISIITCGVIYTNVSGKQNWITKQLCKTIFYQ